MDGRTLYVGVNALDAPAHIARTLERPSNPYGEPLYRLVWAEGRFVESGGEWLDWDENLSITERNPVGREVSFADTDGCTVCGGSLIVGKSKPKPCPKCCSADRISSVAEGGRQWGGNVPIRSVVEVRAIPIYWELRGRWVLERWRGAEAWGTPELWAMPQEFGGTMVTRQGKTVPALGAYPHRGDWVTTGFSFSPTQLSEDWVLRIVGMIEQGLAEIPQDPNARIALAVQQAEAEDVQKSEKRMAATREALANTYNPFDAKSLGGQAQASRELEALGYRSHAF